MKLTVQVVLVAAAMALGASAVAPLAAQAEVSVTFNSGSVAYGYNDGYWDRSHAWHAWPNAQAQSDYRAHNAAHYYDKRHDADKNAGWRGDNWWAHH
jgi:hypothetical protein